MRTRPSTHVLDGCAVLDVEELLGDPRRALALQLVRREVDAGLLAQGVAARQRRREGVRRHQHDERPAHEAAKLDELHAGRCTVAGECTAARRISAPFAQARRHRRCRARSAGRTR